MATYKSSRVSEDIKRELTAVIRELKDPRIADKLLTVVRTEVVSDLSFCKVYVSALEGFDTAKEAAKALTNAQGLIRREVAKRLRLRKAPELRFIADDSVKQSVELWQRYKEHTGRSGDGDENQ